MVDGALRPGSAGKERLRPGFRRHGADVQIRAQRQGREIRPMQRGVQIAGEHHRQAITAPAIEHAGDLRGAQ